MASRTYSNFTGDRGEYRAIAQLLETGAAINSLTSSDTGWDLHLHLPEVPLAFLPDKQLSRARKGWKLSGRIAHVQVKSMEHSSYPTLRRDTVNGWIAGSTVGVPTFVLMLLAEDVIEFADIADLVQFINEEDSKLSLTRELGKVRLGSVRRQRFDPVTFSAIAHLYLKYPALMSTVGSTINDVLWNTPETARGTHALRALITELIDGAPADAFGSGYHDGRFGVVDRLASGLCEDSDWLEENREEILQGLSEPGTATGIRQELYAQPGSRGLDSDLSELVTTIFQVRAKLVSIEAS